MFVKYVAMFTIPPPETRITAYPPELHLKVFPKTGVALFAAPIKTPFHLSSICIAPW
jgi:hypothetical protein